MESRQEALQVGAVAFSSESRGAAGDFDGRSLPVVLAILATLAATNSHARTWIITPAGDGDAPTIQAGIDSAAVGDVVELEAGLYSWTAQGGQQPSSGRTLVILKDGITLRGRDGASTTILDAEQQGRVLLSPLGATSLIEGLTITGGRTEACMNLRCQLGGGILLFGNNSTVRDCIVVSNHAQAGGGGIAVDHSSGTVQGNLILRNSTEAGGNGGGGIGLIGSPSQPLLTENTIVSNIGDGIAAGDAGGVFRRNILAWNHNFPGRPFGGKGVSCAFGLPTLDCNDLWSNEGSDAICGVDAGGNFVADPQFCGADPIDGANYFLQSDSPCLPAGNACSVRLGARGDGCSTVVAARSSWGNFKELYK